MSPGGTVAHLHAVSHTQTHAVMDSVLQDAVKTLVDAGLGVSLRSFHVTSFVWGSHGA